MYIIIAIIMFGVLIGVHEFGHFSAAKLCGVRVNEFAIDMGPVLWKKKKGDTQYSLRLFPIGGYCSMEAEEESSDDPKAFTNKNPLQRVLILCSGAAMNYILGIVLLIIVFAGVKTLTQPVISGFMEGCPYESEQLLQTGDRFVRIDGHKTSMTYDVTEYLGSGGVHDIVLKRNGETVVLEDVELEKQTYDGIEGEYFGFYFATVKNNILRTVQYACQWSVRFVRMVWDSLRQLIAGTVGIKDLSGPVGIVSMITQTGESAASSADAARNILYFCAFIAVNLAVMNMLPIPALDGGRVFCLIVTVILEAILRRKIDPKYEAYINTAGLILLLGLTAVVMYNDIVRLIAG